jgi:hypothetical protein
MEIGQGVIGKIRKEAARLIEQPSAEKLKVVIDPL